MPNPYFQFKQFTIWHDKCAMKVGTDGVLLGAWTTAFPADKMNTERLTTSREVDDKKDKTFSVLDIGTGTGLIAMMIAQRNSNAEIDAIDIDKDACEQAVKNIEMSPFKDKISVIHQSFTEFATNKKYDLIVSNPPYFTHSLKSPDKKRSMARHNDSLPLKQLIEHAMTMLSENGKIALVLPAIYIDETDFILATHRLYIIRRTEVVSVEGSKPKRFLIEISAKAPSGYIPEKDMLVLTTREHKKTYQYNHLTEDFYL